MTAESGDLAVGAAAEVAELFEDAPCGYVTTALDGTILRVNRTFETLIASGREALIGQPFPRLLSVGARIYYETHYAPLLQMRGSVREIAVDLVRADGTSVPALLNSVLHRDGAASPPTIRTIVFEATERRRYEQELVAARDREHGIAGELQRALLAGAMPTDPSLDLAVTYRPAVRGLEIGGDWYDAFWLGPRTVAVVVGDVVGRGIPAGTTMGQLRSALRALASTGLSPGGVLEMLDGYARRHAVGQMTTVVYAELDLDAGRLRYACAGHPPPAIVSADTGPAYLWGGRSTPLDAEAEPSSRAEATVDLVPGAVVLLFTDGLVERADRSLQEGLDLVLSALARIGEHPVGHLAAEVASAALKGGPRTDDICVLALRWAPAA